MNPGFEIKEKMLALSGALLNDHPRVPVLLREIHTHLRADPAIVTLLPEEDIAIIVQGLARQTGVELANAGAKKPSVAKAGLKNLTIDDI